MKASVLAVALLLLLTTTPLFTQTQQFGTERRLGIELDRRAHFHPVDERYRVYEDTLFYANAGFLIHAEYDVIEDLDGTVYVYLTYPDFTDGAQTVPNPGPGYAHDQLPEAAPVVIYEESDSTYEYAPTVPLPSYPAPPQYYELPVQEASGAIRLPLNGLNGRILRIRKAIFDEIPKTEIYDTNWRRGRNYRLTTGFLSVPFKLRPAIDSANFTLATDATIGPYIGITKRLARRRAFYATVPLTLGLSYININQKNTDAAVARTEVGVLPGVSWSTGLIFQLNQFNIGFVLGKDYVSDIGDAWQYHNRTWYAFALGYSFLNEE